MRLFLPRALGVIAGVNAGMAAGAAAGAMIGWRRKRNLPSSESDPIEFPCKLLCQVFTATDRDQDGHLSPEELGLVPVPSAQFLGLVDVDDNTFVEPSEFNDCLPSRTLHLCHDCGICEDLSQVDGLESFMESGYYVPSTGRIYV